ncbi:hypothetical protein JCM19233_3651 [Vibrio astriarenae]|nr:hypothetical protein JCM19233_3651 [Vibrio sp. C7]
MAELGLAEGILTTEEADLLRKAEARRLETINVDDFEPDYLAAKKSPAKLVEVA